MLFMQHCVKGEAVHEECAASCKEQEFQLQQEKLECDARAEHPWEDKLQQHMQQQQQQMLLMIMMMMLMLMMMMMMMMMMTMMGARKRGGMAAGRTRTLTTNYQRMHMFPEEEVGTPHISKEKVIASFAVVLVIYAEKVIGNNNQ